MDAKIYQEYDALKKENIPENDKKKIAGFVDDLALEGISEIRRKNYIQRLRVAARWIPDNFCSPGREDLRIIREHLDKGYTNNGIHKKYSEWTKATYMKMLKKFYRYILPQKQFSELFRNVKINSNPGSKIKPDQMIQQWEIQKMVENATNSRDRALLYTLYDSGCSIGEIITMKIKDLDTKVKEFLETRIEDKIKYLYIDAAYFKVRKNGRYKSMALYVSIGVNSKGVRQILSMDVYNSEDGMDWSNFFFSDDTYSGDTVTPKLFIILLTDLVDTPLIYDSVITEFKAFSTVEYLSNTVVVNDPDLRSGLSSISSPSTVFNFLFLVPFLYPVLLLFLSYLTAFSCSTASSSITLFKNHVISSFFPSFLSFMKSFINSSILIN